MYIASRKGHMNVVQYSIQECHANVEAATNIGATALHIASEKGHMDIIQYLITEGHADVEETTNRWYTVLDVADYFGHGCCSVFNQRFSCQCWGTYQKSSTAN